VPLLLAMTHKAAWGAPQAQMRRALDGKVPLVPFASQLAPRATIRLSLPIMLPNGNIPRSGGYQVPCTGDLGLDGAAGRAARRAFPLYSALDVEDVRHVSLEQR